MTKHPDFRPLVGSHWIESLSDDPFILGELKRLKLSRHLRQTKDDLTSYGKNKRLILRHVGSQAILIWAIRGYTYKKLGIQCLLFVNHSTVNSTELLEEAMKLARNCWIQYPFFIRLEAKRYPENGEDIFLESGWKLVGTTPKQIPIYASNYGYPDSTIGAVSIDL